MPHPIHLASRRHGVRLAGALLVGSALVLGACGTVSKLTTGRAISQSISKIGTQSGVSLRFSLGVDASQAQQLSQKGGGSGLSATAAKALSTGSIFFSEQTGHGEALNSQQAATDKANAVDVGLQIGNHIPFEIRYVSQALYVRVDPKQLLSDIGIDPSKADSFASALQKADAYVPGLAALGQGHWVEVSPAALKSLSGMLNQYASSAAGSSSRPSQSQIRSLVTSLRKDFVSSIENNASYQNLGTQNGQTRYGVTVSVRGFLNQFGPALQKDLDLIPGGLGSKATSGLKAAEAKIPAGQTVVLHLFVQDNKLTEVDVDLNQFAGKDKVSFPVPLKLNVSTPQPITAPSGAAQLDLSKLPQMIGGLLSGGAGMSSSSTNSAGGAQ